MQYVVLVYNAEGHSARDARTLAEPSLQILEPRIKMAQLLLLYGSVDQGMKAFTLSSLGMVPL